MEMSAYSGEPSPFGEESSKSRVPSGPRAGFWQRFGASFIDGILVAIVSRVLEAALKGGAGFGLSVLLGLAYYVSLEGGSTGQTIGKKALGIRVIGFDTGGP